MANAVKSKKLGKVNPAEVEAMLLKHMSDILGISSDGDQEGRKSDAVTFERKGRQVIMPEGLSHPELRRWSEKAEQEEEGIILIAENFSCFPLDGAHALHEAMLEVCGYMGQEKGGFFGMSPPVMINVTVGEGEQIQVPWGNISAPALGQDGMISIGASFSKTPQLSFKARIRKKHTQLIKDIISVTKRNLKEKSIYKGKAIKPSFDWMNNHDDQPFDPENDAPKFVNLSGVDRSRLVFSKHTAEIIDRTIFVPLTKSDQCRKFGVSLKRSTCLSGRFGVGKTLLARAAAVDAIKHGWTFIHCEQASDIAAAYKLAAMYAPSVVFCEDIDRSTDSKERTETLDEILNTIDGVEFKNVEIMLLMTTNNVEAINPAMLRPGRIDSLVNIEPPDAEAVTRLIRMYAGGLLIQDADLSRAGNALAGQIPAVIEETVKQAKLVALQKRDDIDGYVDPEEIAIAAEQMAGHLKLLEPKAKVDSAVEEVRRRLDEGKTAAVEALASVFGSIRIGDQVDVMA